MFDISTLILFCFASLGMTSIIVGGKIFIGVRDFFGRAAERVRQRRGRNGWTVVETIHEIINCNHCCGFWSGLFCGFLLVTAPTVCTCENVINLFMGFEKSFYIGHGYYIGNDAELWWTVLYQYLTYFGVLFCFAAAGSFLALVMQFVLDILHVHTIRFQPQMDDNEPNEDQISKETIGIRLPSNEIDNNESQ